MNGGSSLRAEQRALELGHTIDPGFVNHRKAQTIQGPGKRKRDRSTIDNG